MSFEVSYLEISSLSGFWRASSPDRMIAAPHRVIPRRKSPVQRNQDTRLARFLNSSYRCLSVITWTLDDAGDGAPPYHQRSRPRWRQSARRPRALSRLRTRKARGDREVAAGFRVWFAGSLIRVHSGVVMSFDAASPSQGSRPRSQRHLDVAITAADRGHASFLPAAPGNWPGSRPRSRQHPGDLRAHLSAGTMGPLRCRSMARAFTRWAASRQISTVGFSPGSTVTVRGSPNIGFQMLTKATATTSAYVLSGTEGQLVSTTRRRLAPTRTSLMALVASALRTWEASRFDSRGH